jgi:hypothetical protein
MIFENSFAEAWKSKKFFIKTCSRSSSFSGVHLNYCIVTTFLFESTSTSLSSESVLITTAAASNTFLYLGEFPFNGEDGYGGDTEGIIPLTGGLPLFVSLD